MIKKTNAGFTLFETLAAIVVVVLLVVGIGTGMSAATKSYKESTYQSNCGTFSDIINTSMGDLLRYSESITTDENLLDNTYADFAFTNRDYAVTNCYFYLDENGHILLRTGKGADAEDTPLVNEGAYADSLKVSSLKVAQHEAVNGYYFDISYEIQDGNDSTLPVKQYTLRVRQINAELADDFVNNTVPTDNKDKQSVDAESITIIYDQNAPNDPPMFTEYGRNYRSVTRKFYPSEGTTYTTYDAKISRENYDFLGWNTSKTGGEATRIKPGDSIVFSPEQIEQYAGRDYTLYAEWEETAYYIEYNANFGSTEGSASTELQSYTYQQPVVTLADSSLFTRKGPKVTFNSNIGSRSNNIGGVSKDDGSYSLEDKLLIREVYSQYTLESWNTAKDGTGIRYDLGQTDVNANELYAAYGSNNKITLYAQWSSTATVNMLGSRMTAKWKEAYFNNPLKDHWTFKGWYKYTKDSSIYSKTNLIDPKITGTQNITEDTTYYAQYTTYVTYDLNDGKYDGKSEKGSVVHWYGFNDLTTAVPDNEKITKEGYDFGGWWDGELKGDQVSGTKLEDGGRDTTEARAKFMAERADDCVTCWHAKWTKHKYAVTYTVTVNECTLGNGVKVHELYPPTGYTKPANEQIEYETTYTVKSGTGFGDKTVTIDNKTAGTWKFNGWSPAADSQITIKNKTDITGSWTFTPATYDVTFDSKGGSSVSPQNNIQYGSCASEPTAPTKTGYDFNYWCSDPDCNEKYEFTTPITEDITLYAKWTKHKYTVTYTVTINECTLGNGVKVHESYRPTGYTKPANEQIEYGTTYTVKSGTGFGDKTVTIDNKTAGTWKFSGWSPSANSQITVENNTEITGRWTFTPATYNVTFDSKGGSSVSPQNGIQYGSCASKPSTNPTKASYTFVCWCSDSDCNNEYNFSTPITESITLYAKWEHSVCTVTFNANGHGTAPSAQTVAYGSTATNPGGPELSWWEENINGYTFYGWCTNQSCTYNTLYNFDTPVTQNITLYAKWTPYYTVTFDANGHGTAPAPQIVDEGGKARNPGAPSGVTGYIFDKWCTDRWYYGLQEYDFDTSVDDDITLYASWKKIHKVTYINTKNNSVVYTLEVVDGEKATKYENVDWYTNSNCKNYSKYNFNKSVSNDLTLYTNKLN